MQARDRASFDPGELAVVLSHFDLGVIESVTDFARGSRRSPKVGVVAERGKFLLKRRSLRRADPDRVRFTHRVQKHLTLSGFPAPKLVTTRDHGLELLQLRDHVYELFEFVAGQPFDRTPEETRQAGEVLARFHRLTDAFAGDHSRAAPRGDYHDLAGVRTGLCSIGSTLSSHDSFSGDEAELATLVQTLLSAYDEAASTVNRSPFDGLPERVIHADWHPGNVLYRNARVVAVIDYDTLRLSRGVADVANGALQFSMLAGGDPAGWPEQVDADRFRAFLAGYESLIRLSAVEFALIPPLMIEALIAECVPPITETGSVGRWAGFRVMQMVRRKIAWMASHGPVLVETYTASGPT